ncbi:uncharacterized protein LOC122935427 [Bufo gargarizans]|uniref:uncharacterized protein LOC122935427 n=1 Tax=Bufo gargarizans TaxID=30331 RepID=UPI001CF53D88|nr:uncharacterized protein LOC122935427 [Bufo gargarizans]
MAKDSTANIYTDSRYAFGVVHDFGLIWRARDYITAAGTPIKNAAAVAALMAAVLLPNQVAVIKVKAHTRADTPEARGNALADQAAKEAAVKEERVQSDQIMITQEEITWDLLKQMQKQATLREKEIWLKESALEEESGLWTQGKRVCLPRALYPLIASVAHGPTHQSKTIMKELIDKIWVAPGITPVLVRHTQACLICAECNPGRTEPTPRKCLPKALYPFQRIQIDHIQMPMCQGFQYVLVVIDLFSGWPEAYPVRNQTATTTACTPKGGRSRLLLQV